MSREFLVLNSIGRSHRLERSLALTMPHVWKVILGPSRYGGLRTPSETLSLRWEDIVWEMSRMSIPELRSILDEAFEIFGHECEN